MNPRPFALLCTLFFVAGSGSSSSAFGAAISSNIMSLTRSGSALVGLASSGNLERSTDDGASFTITRAATTTALFSVNASGSTVVAVGDAGYIVRSATGGQAWTDATSVSFPGELRNVAANGSGFWVAVGRSNLNVTALWSSDDGATWTAGTLPAQSGTLRGVVYDTSAARWIAVGTDGLFSARLMISSDGKIWTTVALPAGVNPLSAIATDGQGRELVVGDSGTLLFSADGGQTFTVDANSGLVSENLNTVIYMSGTGWYAGGDQQVQIAYATGSGPSVVQAPVNGGGSIAALAQNASGAILVAGALTASVPLKPGRLVNLSSRAAVGTGDNVLIVGFVITGTTPKPVIIRGIGPALAAAPFNMTGTLPDPLLDLYHSGSVMAHNDNWATAGDQPTVTSAMSRVGAFSLSPTSLDSVIYTTLSPGVYSAILYGNGPANTGVGMVEIYDNSVTLDSTTPLMANISSRGYVGTGDGILIGGFVVAGDTPLTVLIRAVGPTLADLGVSGTPLADPQLSLYRGQTVISYNDNWDSSMAATAAKVGAFTLRSGSKDAVIWVTLNPGVYTAQVSGVGNTTGVALVEVYAVP